MVAAKPSRSDGTDAYPRNEQITGAKGSALLLVSVFSSLGGRGVVNEFEAAGCGHAAGGGLGGDDAADARRYLVTTKSRLILGAKLSGL